MKKKIWYGIIMIIIVIAGSACSRNEEKQEPDFSKKSWQEILNAYKEMDQLKVILNTKSDFDEENPSGERTIIIDRKANLAKSETPDVAGGNQFYYYIEKTKEGYQRYVWNEWQKKYVADGEPTKECPLEGELFLHNVEGNTYEEIGEEDINGTKCTKVQVTWSVPKEDTTAAWAISNGRITEEELAKDEALKELVEENLKGKRTTTYWFSKPGKRLLYAYEEEENDTRLNKYLKYKEDGEIKSMDEIKGTTKIYISYETDKVEHLDVGELKKEEKR